MDQSEIKKHLEKMAEVDDLLYPCLYGPKEELTEEEHQKFEVLWEKMKEVCKEHNVVVIGANGGPIGLSISAVEAYKEAERLRADYTIKVSSSEEGMMKPAFLNESKSKLRTGKGHYKLKKGKKK